MTSSYIPQRIQARETADRGKALQGQVEMLDSYGRFIDDSHRYIIIQALEPSLASQN